MAKDTSLVRLVSNAKRNGLKHTDRNSCEGLLSNPVHCEFNKSINQLIINLQNDLA